MINVDSTHCTGWELHALSKQTDSTRDNNLQEGEQEATIDHDEVRPTIVPKENDFVATVYDKNWYVGRVRDVDENEAMINCMCRAGKYEDAFKWPARKDEIWIDQAQISSILDERFLMEKQRDASKYQLKCLIISKRNLLQLKIKFSTSKRYISVYMRVSNVRNGKL